MTDVQAWHIARLLAALITLGLYFYIDNLLIRRQSRPNAGEDWGPRLIFHLSRLRQLLSLFTLGCAVYVLYQVIPWAEKFYNWRWVPSIKLLLEARKTNKRKP